MARPSKGWRLRKRAGRPFSVRFTHRGEEFDLGLGTHDETEARRLAAERYADTVRGKRHFVRRTSGGGKPLAEVCLSWLSDIAPEISLRTRGTFAIYAETHWSAHWPTLEAISYETGLDYARKRLAKVQAPTVRAEISAIRRFLRWCVEKRLLREAPPMPSIAKTTVGTRHKQGRKGPPVDASPAEIRRIVAKLPIANRLGYPVRARFLVQYETSLRPTFIDVLSTPEHWRHGGWEIRIPPEHDKVRNGRTVPISSKARLALASAAPTSGVIFGPADLRVSVQRAAIAVLGEERGRRFSQHYFRHNRITHWTEQTDNVAGIMELAGHKRIESTSRYVKPSTRAARAVLYGGNRRR